MSSLAFNINTATERVPMTDHDCQELSSIVMDLSGIKLGSAKKTMIQCRLDRRLCSLQIKNYHDYINYLKNNTSEYEQLINALTTNKTEFWRESDHFAKLMSYVATDFKDKSIANPLYVWSAACSTGDEVYTIGILMEEHKKKVANFSYRILGSDIDTSILERAQKGVYTTESIKTVPPQYVGQYFYRGSGDNAGMYKIKEVVRNNVKYRTHNLIEPSEHFPLKFDVIFLRNVLIYFDKENIQNVIDKLVSHLNLGGYLFIGHSESLNGIRNPMKNLCGSVFRKV